jgi:hypothetical protein
MEAKQRFTAFRQGLAKLGWTDGDNVHILARWGAGSIGRTRDYSSELIGLRPEVIVVNTPNGLKALREGTRSIARWRLRRKQLVDERLAHKGTWQRLNVVGLDWVAKRRCKLANTPLPPQRSTAPLFRGAVMG